MRLHRLHHRLHPEQGLHRRAQAVGHQVERPVRGDEGHRAVGVEAGEAYALVELHVLQLHRLALASLALGLHHHLVVQPQLALRHAAQEAPHLQRASHLAVDDVAVAVHQQAHGLQHVQKHLVFLRRGTRCASARHACVQHRAESRQGGRALYFRPSLLQDTAFVTAIDCRTSCTSALWASVLM